MRVINGSAGGIRLKTPEGLHTRPTTERVKEALFSAIQFDIEGRKVLDLFGGSGQLGIEALSRGASSAVIVDNDRSALKIIHENTDKTGFSNRARIICADALKYLEGCSERFDLIFLDPPYYNDLLEKSLNLIARFDILSQNGIIIAEHAKDKTLFADQTYYEYGREYGFGVSKVSVLRKHRARTD